jgi:hypothetical protein
MAEKWLIRFLLGSRELAEQMEKFLEMRLDPAFTFRQEAGEIVVENVDTRDRAWRVALWIKNQSGLRPRFVIEGLDERDNVIYISTCSLCRSGGSHDKHAGGKE